LQKQKIKGCVSSTMRIRGSFLFAFAIAQLCWLYYITEVYIDSMVDSTILDKIHESQNIGATGVVWGANPDRERLKKRRAEGRIVLFVHFHKAGGTSMIHKFLNSGYQSWNRQTNGIPLVLTPHFNAKQQKSSAVNSSSTEEQPCVNLFNERGQTEVLQFWRYTRSQFEAFLRDGTTQLSLVDCMEQNNGNTNNRPAMLQQMLKRVQDPSVRAQFQQAMQSGGGMGNQKHATGNNNRNVVHQSVEFLSLEWNFFARKHFFEPDYLRRDAKIDIITIFRDPYERFLSNFYFRLDNPSKNYTDILEWAHLDLVRKKESVESFLKPTGNRMHLPNVQYGEEVRHAFYFSVNYNKPNYYTAFLNGLAENTDDKGVYKKAPFDFDYFAFGLNQTHLEVAKRRLESMFDVILILERPETFVQMDKWFYVKDQESFYPHRNQNYQNYKYNLNDLNFTREDFYRYNALDKELYEYALELSLSRSSKK